MSITFGASSADTVEVACRWCQEYGSPCDPFCSGTRSESVAPEANFSNSNAYTVIEMLGYEFDYCGEWELSDLHTVQQRLMVAINDRSVRAFADRESCVEKTPGSATMIFAGNTDTDTLRRLKAVQDVVTWAQKNKMGVSWG